MRRSGGWLVAFLLASCAHSEPFGSGNIPANGPPGTGSPLRLTLNPGQNRDPAWLTDQSGIQYSFQQSNDPDLDYCLGVLPPAGGTRLAEKCYPGDPSGQSTDALTNPAPGPGGRLAWVEAHSPVGSLSPLHRTIRTGSLAVTDSGQVAITLPYVASSGQLHTTAIDLAWIGSDTLVYLGAEVLIGSVCDGCKKDTLVTGRDIVLLDLKDPTHTPSVVPGTTSASSVWPSADGTAIYYTLGGDTKVYRRTLGLGAVSVVADLDTLGITRDVSVQDSVLLAVAGGLVSYNVNPAFDRLQGDSGGVLIRLDLRTGGPVALGDTFHYYRRPRLSPDRRFVVTEGTDRTGLQIATLWLITLP